MAGKRSMEARWLRRYKGIACVGVIAVLIPIAELLFRWGAQQLSGMVALCLTPLTVGVGYGVQTLLLGRFRGEVQGTAMDFSFESRRLRLPLRNVLPAAAVSAALGGVIGSGVGRLLALLLQEECNRQIGIPLLIAGCAAFGVVGCLLVPFRFHQLLTVRTMLECVCVFGALLGLYIWAGANISLLFLLCELLYALCFSVLMNQEYVIRHSYSSPTCSVSGAIRRAGMHSAFRLWLLALLFLLPVVVFATLLNTLFRMVLAVGRDPTFADLFCFPFPSVPGLNAALFVLAVLVLLVGAVLLLLRLRGRWTWSDLRAWCRKLIAACGRILKRLLRPLLTPYRSKRRGADKQTEDAEPLHYVETVTPLRRRVPDDAFRDYRSFARRMRRLSDRDEQFRFAYRVLVKTLCAEQKGVLTTQTPSEMARRIAEHTNIASIERLTDVFIQLTYAREGRHASADDLSAVCRALQGYLP